MNPSPAEIDALALRLHRRQFLSLSLLVAPVFYLAVKSMGLSGESLSWTLFVAGPLAIGLWLYLLPLLLIRRETRRAFGAEVEGGVRAARLLELGPRLELMGLIAFLAAGVVNAGVLAHRFEVGWWNVPLVALVVVSYERLASTLQSVAYEGLLTPHQLAALSESEGRVAPGSWWLRPSINVRMRTLVAATCGASLLTLFTLLLAGLRDVLLGLRARGLSVGESEGLFLSELWDEVRWPLLFVGGFLVGLAAWATRAQALLVRRRLTESARLIASLADGRPRPPSWASTDETGFLSAALLAASDTTRGAATLLRQATTSLGQATGALSRSNEEQQQSVLATLAALRETEVTAQELRQTSMLALEKTRLIEQAIARAEEAAQSGRAAIAANTEGLDQIAESVSATARRTRELREWARRIDGIAGSVKELASQSNILALNASIEATRAGVEGRSFGVVAREIRAMADQSAGAAAEVRALIEQVSRAIDEVARQGESGLSIVAQARDQAARTREGIEALSGAVQQNSDAVRQVLAAVNQQSAGIAQIFEALKELSRQADATVARGERSTEASARLQQAGGEVERVLASLDRKVA